MTDTPALPPPTNDSKSGFDLRRMVILGSAALIGLMVLLFVIALVLTLVTGGDFAATIRVIRDLVIIFLSLEGILIILSIAILALQVARLVNLLQTVEQKRAGPAMIGSNQLYPPVAQNQPLPPQLSARRRID